MKKINTKVILAGAFFAALVFPFIAGAATTTSTSSQSVTFTVAKAVEVVNPSGAVDLGVTTPIADGNTSNTAALTRNLTGSGAVTGGHRSNATTTASVNVVTAASGMSSGIKVNGASNCGGSYTTVAQGSSQAVTDATVLARNTDNALKGTLTACFQQPVSWADEGGGAQKTTSITTTIANGA